MRPTSSLPWAAMQYHHQVQHKRVLVPRLGRLGWLSATTSSTLRLRSFLVVLQSHRCRLAAVRVGMDTVGRLAHSTESAASVSMPKGRQTTQSMSDV